MAAEGLVGLGRHGRPGPLNYKFLGCSPRRLQHEVRSGEPGGVHGAIDQLLVAECHPQVTAEARIDGHAQPPSNPLILIGQVDGVYQWQD